MPAKKLAPDYYPKRFDHLIEKIKGRIKPQSKADLVFVLEGLIEGRTKLFTVMVDDSDYEGGLYIMRKKRKK